MKFSVNDKLYDCIITAWTPIRYYLRYRESFTKAWNNVTSIGNFDIEEQEKLLTQLFYIAISGKGFIVYGISEGSGGGRGFLLYRLFAF